MELFIVWITTILSLGAGVLIGVLFCEGESQDKIIKTIKQKATSLGRRDIGGVLRPSAERVNISHDKERSEEDEAFKESFLKDHPEMKEMLP